MPVPHDRAAYKERHEVENLFCRIEDYGRIVPRECKACAATPASAASPSLSVNLQLCP